MDTIINFLKTGRLGGIHLGMPKLSVENLLGNPSAISNSKKPILYKYGSIQLSFGKQVHDPFLQLQSIHIYFADELILPTGLSSVLRNYSSINSNYFLELLENNHVEFELDNRHTISTTQLGYKTKVGVVIIFTLEEGIEKLDGLHFSV